MRLDEALSIARELIDAVDARVLMQHVTGLDHAQQQTHPERELTTAQCEHFAALAARRALGEPVAYLVGRREFYGRDFGVTPAVLIPRPDTEILVEAGLRAIAPLREPRILDLGTGSGIVAITLALERPDAAVVATDISPTALAVARDNATRLGAQVTFIESNWFAALDDARFDLIVSNPPYIRAGDAHLAQGDLRFEPRGALTDNSTDGLASLAALISQAGAHLNAGGALWLEHGFDQAEACRDALCAAGFAEVASQTDLAGHTRVSGGRRAAGCKAPAGNSRS